MERELGLGFRLLLGAIGLAALGSGLFLAAKELRGTTHGSAQVLALLAASAFIVVAFSGGMVLRGALRGRIVVRDPR